MNVDAAKADHRESTSAFDLRSHGDRFLSGARKLGTDHLPALYLACHATELALKSHLRANGYAMSDLASREIGHRIGVALSLALETGMSKPPARVKAVLDFANARSPGAPLPLPPRRGSSTAYLVLRSRGRLGASRGRPSRCTENSGHWRRSAAHQGARRHHLGEITITDRARAPVSEENASGIGRF